MTVHIAILPPYFGFLLEKKDFSGNAVNLDGHGNLVLINSTVQVEVSKLNFNFDEIRTYFLQVSRD